MPPSFKVAEAYVQLGVRGDTQPQLRSARRDSEQLQSSQQKAQATVSAQQKQHARQEVETINSTTAANAAASRAVIGSQKEQIALANELAKARRQATTTTAAAPTVVPKSRVGTPTTAATPTVVPKSRQATTTTTTTTAAPTVVPKSRQATTTTAAPTVGPGPTTTTAAPTVGPGPTTTTATTARPTDVKIVGSSVQLAGSPTRDSARVAGSGGSGSGGAGIKRDNPQAERAALRASAQAARDEARERERIATLAAREIGGQKQKRQLAAEYRAEQQAATNDLRTRVVRLQEEEKYLRSPVGKQRTQEQLRATREIEVAQVRLRRAQNLAQQGPVQGTLANAGDYLTRYEDKLNRVGATAGRVFAAGSAAIFGLASLANPYAIERLQLAFADTGAVIGRELTPVIEKATEWVRWLGDSFVKLDQPTKDLIVNTLTWGTGLAGALMIVPKLIGGLKGILGVVGLATRLFVGMGLAASLSLGPIGLILTGVVAIGAILTASGFEWDKFFGKIAQGFGNIIRGAEDVAKAVAKATGLSGKGYDEVPTDENDANRSTLKPNIQRQVLDPLNGKKVDITKLNAAQYVDQLDRIGGSLAKYRESIDANADLVKSYNEKINTPELKPLRRLSDLQKRSGNERGLALALDSQDKPNPAAREKAINELMAGFKALTQDKNQLNPPAQVVPKIAPPVQPPVDPNAFLKTPGGRAGGSVPGSTSFGASGRDAQFMDALSFAKSFQLDAAKSRLPTQEELQKAALDQMKTNTSLLQQIRDALNNRGGATPIDIINRTNRGTLEV